MSRSRQSTSCLFLCWTIVCAAIPNLANAQLREENGFCNYPRRRDRLPQRSLRTAFFKVAEDIEPNDDSKTAQDIPLGFGFKQDIDVDLQGEITLHDADYFKFSGTRGDIVGLSVIGSNPFFLNSRLAILDSSGAELIENDEHGGVANNYPPRSPFPAGANPGDAALTFVIPSDGVYQIRICPKGFESGRYIMQARIRKPYLSEQQAGEHQVIFLDFDGAEINAKDIFGDGGNPKAKLSPLSDFLPGWGVAADQESKLIDMIVSDVKDRFAALLAGESRENYKISILSSREVQADPFGNKHVSRVIVGGKISELGIQTIGLAQYVDPGNFATDDTAVVLLDQLSAPAENLNSVNSIRSVDGFDKLQAVSRVIGAVVVHEVCHLLGSWHTDNRNSLRTDIDEGGHLLNMAGVGPDGIMGNADDIPSNSSDKTILGDVYADEGIASAGNRENVDTRTIFALSVGKLTPTEMQARVGNELTQAMLAKALMQAKTSNSVKFDPKILTTNDYLYQVSDHVKLPTPPRFHSDTELEIFQPAVQQSHLDQIIIDLQSELNDFKDSSSK